MPIQTQWDDQARGSVRLQFEGRWTITELEAAGEEMARLLAARPTGGTAIIDLTAGAMLPRDLVDHAAIFSTPQNSLLKDVNQFVVVGSNRAGVAIFQAFSRIFRNNTLAGRTTFAETLPEARALISAQAHIPQDS